MDVENSPASVEQAAATVGRAAPRRSWGALVAIGLTALACCGALLYRTEVRSRYWAWRLTRATDPAECAVYLGALCNAGESGRWGVAALLDDPRGQVRQYGVLALQPLRTPWARARLRELLADTDPHVRNLAESGLALPGDPSADPNGSESVGPANP
jgi:hypothetical protein